MAIVKLGSLVVGVRGTVGGVVYSAAAGNPYARAWGRSSNPRGVRQMSVRGNLGRLAVLWQGLTAGQREDWDDLAVVDPEPGFNSLGEPITYSGWNYFCRCNARRQLVGLNPSVLAPTGGDALRPDAPSVTAFFVQITGTDFCQVEYTLTDDPPDHFLVVSLAVLPTGGIVYEPDKLRFVGTGAGDDSSVNLWPEFNAVFGDVQLGWTVTGLCWDQSAAGLRSEPVQLFDVVG